MLHVHSHWTIALLSRYLEQWHISQLLHAPSHQYAVYQGPCGPEWRQDGFACPWTFTSAPLTCKTLRQKARHWLSCTRNSSSTANLANIPHADGRRNAQGGAWGSPALVPLLEPGIVHARADPRNNCRMVQRQALLSGIAQWTRIRTRGCRFIFRKR